MVGDVIDRCPTGIVGFDKICRGGFVRNSDNLIVGGPGSGKSTFLMQFLWNGAMQFGENGLYCSFEPDIVDTLEDGKSYGWDFSKLSAEGKIKFMRFAPQTDIQELKTELTKIIARNNIKRICFDPISVLALNLNDPGRIRQTIFDLSALMKRLKVTTIFVDESLEDAWTTSNGDWTKTDILRFLSDSVTVFYEYGVTGVGDRGVRITKMRRTAHERRPARMIITSKGIEIGALQGDGELIGGAVAKPVVTEVPVVPEVTEVPMEPVVPEAPMKPVVTTGDAHPPTPMRLDLPE